MAKQMTLGLIVGNRGFFPDHLVEEGRTEVMGVLAQEGFKVVCLTPEDTPFGSVETRADAKQCAELFKAHAEEIDGVLVTLPNFGDERAVAPHRGGGPPAPAGLLRGGHGDGRAVRPARRRAQGGRRV